MIGRKPPFLLLRISGAASASEDGGGADVDAQASPHASDDADEIVANTVLLPIPPLPSGVPPSVSPEPLAPVSSSPVAVASSGVRTLLLICHVSVLLLCFFHGAWRRLSSLHITAHTNAFSTIVRTNSKQ